MTTRAQRSYSPHVGNLRSGACNANTTYLTGSRTLDPDSTAVFGAVEHSSSEFVDVEAPTTQVGISETVCYGSSHEDRQFIDPRILDVSATQVLHGGTSLSDRPTCTASGEMNHNTEYSSDGWRAAARLNIRPPQTSTFNVTSKQFERHCREGTSLPQPLPSFVTAFDPDAEDNMVEFYVTSNLAKWYSRKAEGDVGHIASSIKE